MGLRSWLRAGTSVAARITAEGVNPVQVAEASAAAGAAVPQRRGLEYGIPAGGTQSASTTLAFGGRAEHLEQLYQAYKSCPWVSATIDVVARTVTAGGVHVVPDVTPEDGTMPEKPEGVLRLERLLQFVNPREDFIQLARTSITDLMVAGDAYIEVSWLLGEPVAFYSLDTATMTIDADEHGVVRKYIQKVDANRDPVEFKPEEIIHISLDAPRGGLYGTSPTDKALIAVTTWLFAAACLKETMRKGNPGTYHVDLNGGEDPEQWRAKYAAGNLGPKNIGTPITTKGKGVVNQLQRGAIVEYLETLKSSRDEILSVVGVPPHKVGIIETGNLGGGSGEAQDKTYRTITVQPIKSVTLEKFNFCFINGFGIVGWHIEFVDVDMRDSKVIEDIRDLRVRNGTHTLNKARAEIGEPPVEGGDDAILVDRQGVMLWADVAAGSAAMVAGKAPQQQAAQPQQGAAPAATKPAARPKTREVRSPDADLQALDEAWTRAYQHRRRRALRELPPVEVN